MSHSYVQSERQPGDILILQKNVDAKHALMKVQDVDVPFESEHTITAIKVLNKWNDGTGGYVEIKGGGVGHKFVTINLKSQRSRGFSFDIEIWGKPLPPQHGPPPHHHHPPPPHHHHHH